MAETVGPYQLIRRIAEGGMAEIYLARQIGIEGVERTLVVKRVLPALGSNEEFVTMFLDEARLMAALSHPNIAQVFELGKDAETYYLVMEYVRGATLHTLLQRAARAGHRGFPESVALGIGLAISEALSYVHERRDEYGRPLDIVHRDLNPANVMISYDGAIKLIDFGIAKAATKVYATRTGVIKGTFGYIAPEQIGRTKRVDRRADVFALGVLLYEMCLGKHPFDVGTDRPQLLEQVLAANYRRPRQVKPDFPAALDDLIGRCLAPRPEDRPAEMRVVIRDLAAYLASCGLVPTLTEIAEFVRSLVPDAEGPLPLKPLHAHNARRAFPASTGTMRVAGATVGEGGEAVSGDAQTAVSPGLPDQNSETRVESGAAGGDARTRQAADPPADNRPSADLSVAATNPMAKAMPEPESPKAMPDPESPRAHDEIEQLLDDLPTAASGSALPSPTPVGAGRLAPPSVAPPAKRERDQALFAMSAVLVVGLGIAAFLTARAIGNGRPSDNSSPTQVADLPTPPSGDTADRFTDRLQEPPTAAALSADGSSAVTPDATPPKLRPLQVVSEPAGATVTMDGIVVAGVTPVVAEVSASAAQVWVRVHKEGFVAVERAVEASAGETRFVLRPLAVETTAPVPQPGSTPSPRRYRNRQRRQR